MPDYRYENPITNYYNSGIGGFIVALAMLFVLGIPLLFVWGMGSAYTRSMFFIVPIVSIGGALLIRRLQGVHPKK